MKKYLLFLILLLAFHSLKIIAQENIMPSDISSLQNPNGINSEFISEANNAMVPPVMGLTGSVSFDPLNSAYINVFKKFYLNQDNFTVTAWIKPEFGSANSSIIARRNAAFTEGFDFGLNGSNQLQISWWSNGSFESITSKTVLPYSIWHEIAIIYDGSMTSIYIDGVLDSAFVMDRPDNADWDLFIGASGEDSPSNFYAGSIDEVRFWNVALSTDQLHFMMNQQIEEDTNFVAGSFFMSNNFTPTKNDVSTLSWSSLEAYFPMTEFSASQVKDESSNKFHGKLVNSVALETQSAPLPYKSTSTGTWDDYRTWENGDYQTIPGENSIVDSDITVDWNIVETSDNIFMSNSHINKDTRSLLALAVNERRLTIVGNNTAKIGYGLNITHYLSIGKVSSTARLDLEGESQLIQPIGSDFDPTSGGTLERDQQGTADRYTYNYWSSPVGIQNAATNNNSYTVKDILLDGGSPINFLTTGYDGTATSPIGIADYWIWKYDNRTHNTYSEWQHVRSTGTLTPGEGFTMKGPGTGAISDLQNYVFRGKPNNGDINLTVNQGNDYLVGNPYPSALDANQFIIDNSPALNNTGSISGTLYFWEHWGGASHYLSEYQGGYATYNLSGGVAVSAMGTNDPLVATGGTPTKTPGRYIPISQGFFVYAEGNGGQINFNNGQRIFQKEGSNSQFMRTRSNSGDLITEDNRKKIRLGFYSPSTLRRQILLTIDENTTPSIDWGYDGMLKDNNKDDMFWIIDDKSFVIQGSNDDSSSAKFPIGIRAGTGGLYTFQLDGLENFTNSQNVYLHDIINDTYFNLKDGKLEILLDKGEHLNQFEITLSSNQTLEIEEIDPISEKLNAYFYNTNESIVLHNPENITVKSLELVNLLGQSAYHIENISEAVTSEYVVKSLSSGTYVLKINTASGSVSKKVLVK